MGVITDIQRFSIHDGPGIRTTVFLKGCPLDCVWCHNPETKRPGPQLSYQKELCAGCMHCVGVCPGNAHFDENGLHRVDFSVCGSCGVCTGACPAQALSILGKHAGVSEVMDTVLRDSSYYKKSGGGLTLSGGEPLFQPEFAAALLEAGKRNGLHTAVETSGFGGKPALEMIAGFTDLFLFDYKETDPENHRKFTGQDNAKILANLQFLLDLEKPVQLRCPIIPGYNDRDEHFRGIAKVLKSNPALLGAELMPYHSLGRAKSERVGAAYAVAAESSAGRKAGWIRKVCEFGAQNVF